METKEKLTINKAIENAKANRYKLLLVIGGFILICYILIYFMEHRILGDKVAITMGQGLFLGTFYTVVQLIKNK